MENGNLVDVPELTKQYVKSNLLNICDGLPAHRSKVVAQYLSEQLPAYAPELNLIEYLWGNVRGNDLADFSTKELWALSNAARAVLLKKGRRLKTNPRVLAADGVGPS